MDCPDPQRSRGGVRPARLPPIATELGRTGAAGDGSRSPTISEAQLLGRPKVHAWDEDPATTTGPKPDAKSPSNRSRAPSSGVDPAGLKRPGTAPGGPRSPAMGGHHRGALQQPPPPRLEEEEPTFTLVEVQPPPSRRSRDQAPSPRPRSTSRPAASGPATASSSSIVAPDSAAGSSSLATYRHGRGRGAAGFGRRESTRSSSGSDEGEGGGQVEASGMRPGMSSSSHGGRARQTSVPRGRELHSSPAQPPPCHGPSSTDFEREVVRRASRAMTEQPGPQLGQASSWGPSVRRARRAMDAASLVSHHLLVGNQDDALDEARLAGLGVTHVLNAASGSVASPFPAAFVYLRLELQDDDAFPISRHFRAASAFMSRAEDLHGRCLVHCISGVSRSVTLVLAHLMLRHGMTLRDAYTHLHTCRPFISPNKGFKLALAKLEVELKGATSMADHPDWSFFEWNSIKHTYKRQDAASGCCAIA